MRQNAAVGLMAACTARRISRLNASARFTVDGLFIDAHPPVDFRCMHESSRRHMTGCRMMRHHGAHSAARYMALRHGRACMYMTVSPLCQEKRWHSLERQLIVTLRIRSRIAHRELTRGAAQGLPGGARRTTVP